MPKKFRCSAALFSHGQYGGPSYGRRSLPNRYRTRRAVGFSQLHEFATGFQTVVKTFAPTVSRL